MRSTIKHYVNIAPVYSLQFSYELDIFLKNKIDKRTEIVLYKNPKWIKTIHESYEVQFMTRPIIYPGRIPKAKLLRLNLQTKDKNLKPLKNVRNKFNFRILISYQFHSSINTFNNVPASMEGVMYPTILQISNQYQRVCEILTSEILTIWVLL